VPAFIKADFEVNNPGVTVISWDMVQGYWRASYKIDNRLNYDFYDQSGVDFRASLPVIQNNVPEAVVTTALNVHGPIVYGITKVKSANSTDIYQLRLLENGTTRIVWMDADGKAVTDVFKVKPDDAVVKAKQE
jgi:predicted sugar kinase